MGTINPSIALRRDGATVTAEPVIGALLLAGIDITRIYRYGWRAKRGGPISYADALGLKRLCARAGYCAGHSGDESLRPAPLLRRLAGAGRGFASLS